MIRSHHFSTVLTISDAIAGSPATEVLALLKQAVNDVGLNAVGELAVTFQPQGVSAVLVLEESHVALHLWTEIRKVSIDIHICDYTQNNLPKAKKLAEELTLRLSGSARADWRHCSTTG